MSLTERIKTIASDVLESGPTEPSLRNEFDTFKNEVSAQLDDLRKDFQTVLEQLQSGNK